LIGLTRGTVDNFPLRFKRTQFPKLDAGIPSRFAAWLMPIDSPSRKASTLNSSVYCRFGAVALAMTFSVHQNIIKILMYVETGQDQTPEQTVELPRSRRSTDQKAL
jgi:hypothetical protein